MKLPGDPWNNRWCSFYGIPWNFSMELHANCPNPPWKIPVEKLKWNSMEIGVLIVHGIPWQPFPWNPKENVPNSPGDIFHMEIHGEISMEIDGLILHGTFRGGFFTRVVKAKPQRQTSEGPPEFN